MKSLPFMTFVILMLWRNISLKEKITEIMRTTSLINLVNVNVKNFMEKTLKKTKVQHFMIFNLLSTKIRSKSLLIKTIKFRSSLMR